MASRQWWHLQSGGRQVLQEEGSKERRSLGKEGTGVKSRARQGRGSGGHRHEEHIWNDRDWQQGPPTEETAHGMELP